MMSLRDLIEASFFVRSTSVDDADAPLFLVKSELKKREKKQKIIQLLVMEGLSTSVVKLQPN